MAEIREKARQPVHLSGKVLVVVWAALLAFTALTVGLASANLGRWSIVAVLVIAATKSGLVSAYFMHLRYERVRLYLLLLVITVLTLAILLWLTFADVGARY